MMQWLATNGATAEIIVDWLLIAPAVKVAIYCNAMAAILVVLAGLAVAAH
jgi:hypothetical protein